MGEYGFDYDTGKVTYHYGDGFATDDSGSQFMELGGDHVVDLDTNKIHYSPSGGISPDTSIWVAIGIGLLFLCIVYTVMVFTVDVTYIWKALCTGAGMVFAFGKVKW